MTRSYSADITTSLVSVGDKVGAEETCILVGNGDKSTTLEGDADGCGEAAGTSRSAALVPPELSSTNTRKKRIKNVGRMRQIQHVAIAKSEVGRRGGDEGSS